MTNELQVVTFIPDYVDSNKLQIEISRYDNFIQVRMGDQILGSVEIKEGIDQRGLNKKPLAIIRIVEGYEVIK
jgi:hypothetical protein